MRGRVAIVSILALAAMLLARRHRRARRATPLTAPPAPGPAPVASLEPPARFVSVPWALVAAPGDRPQLTVRFPCDEHMQLDRVDAQETPTQVFVTVLVRWRPPAGGWFAWTGEREATVTLSGPLGTRALVHAPVDVEAPATADDDPPAAAGDEPSGPSL